MLIPVICAENLHPVKKAERTGLVQSKQKINPNLTKRTDFLCT